MGAHTTSVPVSPVTSESLSPQSVQNPARSARAHTPPKTPSEEKPSPHPCPRGILERETWVSRGCSPREDLPKRERRTAQGVTAQALRAHIFSAHGKHTLSGKDSLIFAWMPSAPLLDSIYQQDP